MRKTYAAKEISITYDARICIHARRCVEGAPEVFDPQARPWVAPGKADADKIAEVIARCPTGALRYERLDGGPLEPVPPEVTLTLEKDGPIYVRGPMPLTEGNGNRYEDASTRYALCRCGGSGNKPFCDGTHRTMGFEG
ncbi:MAG TPA: (4Fe-4S)-binding protein [Thermoanaerobaculia bacterium]